MAQVNPFPLGKRLDGKTKRSPSPNSTFVPSGTIWPTGEFSLGYAKHRADDSQWFRNIADSPDGWLPSWETGEPPSPLNLSDVPKSHKPIGPTLPRGLKGITGYGRNMVKSFGALVNRHYPNHRVTFGTVTFPPLPPDSRAALVRLWPELNRQLQQYLTRRLESAGQPPLVASVTEIQPKRLVNSGEGYLHLHILWLNKPAKAGEWSIDPVDMREWLTSFLWRKLEGYQGGHVNVNVKPVDGEVSRYMAKYMSKGSADLQEAMKDWGYGVCPPTWWNMTKPARDWVKSAIFKGREPGELLEQFLHYAWAIGPDEIFAFLRHIEMEWEGILLTVGWRGRLHPEVYEDALGML